MQNTVTELSHRLLRSLDSNYNVIDMPAVVEIISALERTSITEELLKTTRLGKYINELRRKTSNEALAKRAKELLKKWRDQVLPSSQSNTSSTTVANGTTGATKSLINTFSSDRSNSPDLIRTLNHKKRPLSSLVIEDSSSNGRKRIKMNGRHAPSEQIYISDNSNSSPRVEKKIQNIVVNINSDSNSSLHDINDRVPPVNNDTNLTFAGRNLGGIKNDSLLQQRVPTPTPQQPPPAIQKPEPKKRGRKKGSKNHKTLLVQAEESFTNKMAVSVNAKVKTTQELLASIQNKSLNSTNLVSSNSVKIERVISPKINNVIEGVSSPKIALEGIVKNEKSKLAGNICDSRVSSPKLENKLLKREILRSHSPVCKIDLDSENSHSSFQESVPSACITREGSEEESDIIEVGDSVKEDSLGEFKRDEKTLETHGDDAVVKQETAEDILIKLPKVDRSFLYEEPEEPQCTCVQAVVKNENITIEFHGSQQRVGGGGSIFDVPDTLSSTSGDENSEVNSRTAVVTNEIINSVPEPYINSDCPAKRYLEQKYRLGEDQVTDERVQQLHTRFLDSVNGNKCEKTANRRNCDVIATENTTSGLYSNIVPNFHAGEIIRKDITLESINYIKYKKILPYPNVSVDNERTTKCCDDDEQLLGPSSGPRGDADDGPSSQVTVSSNVGDNTDKNHDDTQQSLVQESKQQHLHTDESADEPQQHTTHENFREFHECVSLRSYNNELLPILPYVVLD